MMHISKDFYIQCSTCNNVILVESDDLDCDTAVYTRPMGEEIEYDFCGEMCCEKCHSWIDFSIRGYEYPTGALNYSVSECHGGDFINEPVPEIDYEYAYEFDYDYYDVAYTKYERVEDLLAYHREKIKRMTPREFEFFVAEIFEQQGFSVKITKRTRDGGKDIIATKADPIPYTLIIECKHWREQHKVDVSVVRSVYGVQMATQANQSVIVTSSKFTRDARKFVEEQKTMMALFDIDDLLKLVINH